MSTTSLGHNAEEQVARYLKEQGHKIIERNWRTRWCEIDIISKKDNCVFFTEVKYRSSDAWGSGLEYITPKKLGQMKFAAELWLSNNNWSGDSVLQAAEVNSTRDVELIELND